MENAKSNEKIMRDQETALDDLSKLPKAKGWYKHGVTLYQGFWFRSSHVPNIITFQKKFQAQDQDIVLVSNPKSGTTWMKALLFSILNRDRYTPPNTPLLSSNPHDLVPSFEFSLFSDPPTHDLTEIPSPRLFSTHIPYACLPESVVSKSRIVYICRNPLDSIVSFWHFVPGHLQYHGPQWTLEECVEAFCKGESIYGPFWDHVLGFWRASLENPKKVLFLRYEDMLEDTASYAKRVAEFVGFPFTDEEKNQGVVEQIVELCSFKKLRELDVNKSGNLFIRPELRNEIFFRKGVVGDWVDHLSPSMVERVNEVIQEKLCGNSGLNFKYKI